MFSRADGENEPSTSELGSEARLDLIVPVDSRPSSDDVADARRTSGRVPVMLTYSEDNVGFPPTDAELRTAFGDRPSGFTAFVIDGGGAGTVWLVIRSKSNTWHYVELTKAV